MKYQLEVPWTSKLPVARWWIRRHSALGGYAASSRAERPAAVFGLQQPPPSPEKRNLASSCVDV
jgi:hypothetical protein